MKKPIKRKIFGPEFKTDAVRLAEKIGAGNAAQRLGIHVNNIHRWRVKKNFPVEKSQDVFRLQMEVRRLKKALSEEKLVVDFLKKTIAFFSKENQK